MGGGGVGGVTDISPAADGDVMVHLAVLEQSRMCRGPAIRTFLNRTFFLFFSF